jgi:hypothetical protein
MFGKNKNSKQMDKNRFSSFYNMESEPRYKPNAIIDQSETKQSRTSTLHGCITTVIERLWSQTLASPDQPTQLAERCNVDLWDRQKLKEKIKKTLYASKCFFLKNNSRILWMIPVSSSAIYCG